MKDLAKQFKAEMQATHNMRNLVEEERADSERDMSDVNAAMEAKHNHELSKREAAFQGKIMEALDKFTRLNDEFSALRADLEERARGAGEEHAAARARMVRAHEEALRTLTERLERGRAALEHLRRSQGESLLQGAEEAEGELEGLRGEYKARMAVHRETALRCKSENGVMKKKYSEMQAALEVLKGDRDRLEARCEELRTLIGGLEKEIAVLQGIALEKDALMASKEDRISACALGRARVAAFFCAAAALTHISTPNPTSPLLCARSWPQGKVLRAGEVQVCAGRKDPGAQQRGGPARAGD